MVRQTRASTKLAETCGVAFTATKAIKTRRPHTKSRKGCVECKDRHIRCDERQPACANCETADRSCFYPPSKVPKFNQKRMPRQRHDQERRNPVTRGQREADNIDDADTNADEEHVQGSSLALRPRTHTEHVHAQKHHDLPAMSSFGQPLTQHLPGLSTASDAVSEAVFKTEHLVLLHHAVSVPNYTGANRSAVDIAIRHAVDSPYLINEVLAFTAFHLAHLYPGSARQLENLATELQTCALASFSRLTENLPINDKATAVPRFLFSAILGRHYLADTLAHSRSNFHLFIDRLAESLSLNRGIRVITPSARDTLHDSELQPFLRVVLDAQSRVTSPGAECDSLIHVIAESDLSEASASACYRTIKVLQHSFDLCRYLATEDYPQAVSTFSVHVEPGFVDLLRKYQPEALIILSFFGVLLHRCHGFWAFHNAAAYMVRAIANHLGIYWQKALEWPLHIIDTEVQNDGAESSNRPCF